MGVARTPAVPPPPQLRCAWPVLAIVAKDLSPWSGPCKQSREGLVKSQAAEAGGQGELRPVLTLEGRERGGLGPEAGRQKFNNTPAQ